MKAFGLVLLALFVGFVGYQFAYPKLDDWAQFQNYERAVTVPTDKDEAVKFATKSSALTEKLKNSKTSAEMPPEVTPVVMPTPEPVKPEPKPEVAVKKPEPAKPKALEDGFVPPPFQTLEDLTKNWAVIPPSVFTNPNITPKVLKEIEFESNVGGKKVSTKVAPGTKVTLVSQEGPTIAIAPAPGSPMRARVPLDDTDLKDLLTTAYENWKPSYVDYMHRKFLASKNLVKPGPAGPSTSKGAGDKPEKSPDGTYPLLVTSMNAGQVTEVTPKNIKRWADPVLEKSKSKEFWTVVVGYTTKTMFGDFDTEGKAWVLGSKVEKWTYVGSGEVIP